MGLVVVVYDVLEFLEGSEFASEVFFMLLYESFPACYALLLLLFGLKDVEVKGLHFLSLLVSHVVDMGDVRVKLHIKTEPCEEESEKEQEGGENTVIRSREG